MLKIFQKILFRPCSRFRYYHHHIKVASEYYNYLLSNQIINKQTTAQNYSSNTIKPDFVKAKIIVIGSGISGLSAANHLFQSGFKNVKILEAADRIGGRIYTKEFGDAVCELGAKTIPANFFRDEIKKSFASQQNNTELNELERFNLQFREGGKYRLEFYKKPRKYLTQIETLKANRSRALQEGSNCENCSFIASNGDILQKEIVEKANLAFFGVLTEADYKIKSFKFGSMNSNTKMYLEKETENLTKSLFGKKPLLANLVFRTLIRDLAGKVGSDLSLIHMNQLPKISTLYSTAESKKLGISSILDPLIKGVSEENLLLSKPISSIKWANLDSTEYPSVLSFDGTIYSADHVICTIPVGVLKMFSSLLFNPELPRSKLAALDEIGMGTPGSVFLKYPSKISSFLVHNSIKPVWNYKELQNRADFVKDIVEISRLPKSEQVLEFKRAGDQDFEKLPDEIIVSKTTAFLKALTKNDKIPFPIDILRTNWATDSKFLGGVPYITSSNGMQLVKILRKPLYGYSGNLKPTLLFAGDYCEWVGFGTIVGARNSGIRAADKIIQYYKNHS